MQKVQTYMAMNLREKVKEYVILAVIGGALTIGWKWFEDLNRLVRESKQAATTATSDGITCSSDTLDELRKINSRLDKLLGD